MSNTYGLNKRYLLPSSVLAVLGATALIGCLFFIVPILASLGSISVMMTNPPAILISIVSIFLLWRVHLLILILFAALTSVLADVVLLSEHWEQLGVQRDHFAAFLRYSAGFGIVLSVAQIIRLKIWGNK